MKKYKVKIKGVAPLVWNRIKRENELEKKELKKDQLNEWEENNWRQKAEYDKKGILIVPREWIHSALIRACQKTALVPNYATKKNRTYTDYMTSCEVMNTKSPGTKKQLVDHGEYVAAQGKKGGGKVWRIWPVLKEWKTEFEFWDVGGRMLEKEIKELLKYAGMFCGLGDLRYKRFGRFELVSIQEMK